MPSAIGRLALAAILALGALPSAAHAHGDGAGATPWVQAGTGMGGRAMAPFGHAVAPRAAVIVAPQQRVIVVPQQHTTTTHEHAMMAHGHPVLVVPGTVLVVPQTPVYYVAAPYASCIWCDELGCVRQTLDFCATFAGP